VTNLTNGCKINTAQENIITFLEAMNQDSDAVQDCNYAINLSVELLEKHFQGWLWVDSTEWLSYSKEDRAYALELGHIEEELTLKGWIYEEEVELLDFNPK
jgi:hypothetical protein